MKKIYIVFIVIGVFSTQSVYPQGQTANKIQLPMIPKTQDVVPVDLAYEIAIKKAQERFGEGTAGEPIIGYDLNGNVRAYIVPYRIGDTEFPTEKQIFEDMNEARQLIPQAKKQLAEVRETSLGKQSPKLLNVGEREFLVRNLEWKQVEQRLKDLEYRCWGIDDYGYVTVSGRKDLVPILEFSNTLPYYYTYRTFAEEKAKESLGCISVSLSRFYYGGSLDQIFEFQSPTGRRIWVAFFPMRVVEPGENALGMLEIAEAEKVWINEKWKLIGNTTDRADHWIDGRNDVVPAYLWTAGCTPTSATMVLGYYDWYSPIGRWTSWGLLLPWYFERSVIKKYTDPSGHPYFWDTLSGNGHEGIPYSVYELAFRMNTDGSTGGTHPDSVLNGILDWTNDNNWCGYSFSGNDYFTTSNWSAIWDTIRNQINNDRPCLWSRDGNWSPGGSGGHSVAAIGYSDAGNVYYRSTWDLGWHADPYQGNGQTMAQTVTIIPCAGSDGNDIEVFSPDGGETWQAGSYHDISWYQFGTDIYDVDLYYSVDSGYSWTSIENYVPSNNGWNYYSWLIPNVSCTDAFVSIDAYDYNGYYTAAEGSEDRFEITQVGIDENNKPGRFSNFNLAQNYPDPVFSKTVIKYSLPKACKVVLELFDVSGRKVMVLVDEYQKSGCYQVRLDIDKSSLANGIYFYRLKADNSTATKKLVVCR